MVFPAGAELMRQGEASDCMYMILSGLVAVERAHPDVTSPVLLATFGPGEVVGEMGVLDGKPRSATVTALEETRAMRLDAGTLASTMARFPEVAAALLRIMSQRLRSTNRMVEEAALMSWTRGSAAEQ